ncbi:putative membrane protein [Propionispora sp. 2/2-37]|uniref:GerAB/ArcD/ProY family transporter n=1 Tax=Propionispora sp. 2/2-37 TaxID=1677858 RepID=UPI0006BB6458|nr:GerAB/ArcD/ProY family transporter [Propionispora sp. 2/2-37]CUH94965.1 putative membrane protein [Propionispora sp. 2/2-37]
MSFQHGSMGKAEAIGIIFSTTMVRIFLSNPVYLLATVGEIAWIVSFLGGILGILAFYGFLYVYKRIPEDLFDMAKNLLGLGSARFIAVFCIGVFVLNAVLLFRQFTENTLLTSLPNTDFQIVSLAYAVCIAIMVYIGIEGIGRSMYIIIPFGVAGLGAVLLMLYPFYCVYNLTPWRGYGLLTAAKSVVLASGYNVGILALFAMASSFPNSRTLQAAAIFGLGGSSLVKGTSLLVYTLVYGVQVGQEKVLPFFEMARLVHLSRYLQRIESLFIILWVIAGVIAIAVSVYAALFMLCKLLDLPAMRPMVPLTMLLILGLASLPKDIISAISMDNYLCSSLFAGAVYGISAVLLIALWVKALRKRRGRRCTSG